MLLLLSQLSVSLLPLLLLVFGNGLVSVVALVTANVIVIVNVYLSVRDSAICECYS